MSDQKDAVISTESTESTTEVNTDEQKQISVEEFESLKQMLESVKAAQTGVDRKNTELRKQLELKEKELEEQKKSQMSHEEILDFERQKAAQEKEAAARELQELKRQTLVKDFLLEKGLDKKFERYLKGDTLEDLEKEAEELLTGINAEVERRVKDQIRTPTPQKGTTEQPPVDISKMTYAELVRYEQSKKK